MTERLHFHFSLSRFGEGNGNPLQCSCLENPRDGGAWWAAISGVTQSQTRLKRLSSSSSILPYHCVSLLPSLSPLVTTSLFSVSVSYIHSFIFVISTTLFYFLSESPEMFTEVLMLPSFCAAAAAAKSLQSCPTLCDPRDGSPPGSSIPGILQARTLEWVAISFSNA